MIQRLTFIATIFLLGCAHQNLNVSDTTSGVTVFLYSSNILKAAQAGDEVLESEFMEYFRHLGRKGTNGEVGIGLVFPYLNWTEGEGRGPYLIPTRLKERHETILKVAAKMKIPVLVQFNGGPWHSPSKESAFIHYWKTIDGGIYLSRYKDGKVNSAIDQKARIPKTLLEEYLAVDPYGGNAEDSLFFTLSPYANDFRHARLEALRTAVKFWKQLDEKYPGTIRAFTTDSEVGNLSFRISSDKNREIPIGYETWNTEQFCKTNQVKDCAEFFIKEFTYKDSLEIKWRDFRAKNHQIFIQDTVDVIREYFSTIPIYTHQMAVLDEESFLANYKNQDLGSPQVTAFVERANPGFTVYTYAGDQNNKKKRFVDEVQSKIGAQPWGFLEFNTAAAFSGNKEALANFTEQFLRMAQAKGVRLIAPLSWKSNSLDSAIKDNGVDEGIRHFIENTR